MKKNQIFEYIEDFYNCLRNVNKHNLTFKYKNENNTWVKLEESKPSKINELPGFYIVKIDKKYKKNPYYTENKEYFEKTDIVYIGESSNLKNRISALRTSIGKDRGKGSHSGGITLGKELQGEESDYKIWWIYTSEKERKCDKDKKDQGPYLAKLFERYLVYSFLEKNKEKPIANKE